NPVPFCVLDEVEAALDDANVTRFAQFFLKYGMKTQFIVITHRRGTMRQADQLYGVVMKESGVSQVLSVSLKEMKNKNEVKELGLFDRIKKSLFGKKDEEDENKKEEKQTEQENEAKPES